jgi:cardiolipin synthase
VTLTIPHVPVAFHIPAWLTILTISRDLLIALSALSIHLRTGHSHFPPSLLGKCTTAAQLAIVGLALVSNFVPRLGELLFHPAVLTTMGFTLASGLHYLHRSVKLIELYQKAEEHDGKTGSDNH